MKDVKISFSITEDGNNMLIIDGAVDSLFARISFYDNTIDISDEEKIELGQAISSKLVSIVASRNLAKKEKSWETRCEAFLEAYQYEQKSEPSITWLMSTILGLSSAEATRRYQIASELMMHPDFKDKEDSIVNKVYLNKGHLDSTELKDAELIDNSL